MYVTVYIFSKFGKHDKFSWKNNMLKINMVIQQEVYIDIKELSIFGGEQSISVCTMKSSKMILPSRPLLL